MSAMLKRFFQPRPARIAGEALYAAAAAQARTPGFYRELGVQDTREGRFELYTLHVILLMDRLRRPQPDQVVWPLRHGSVSRPHVRPDRD